jgi:hypothetical protein
VRNIAKAATLLSLIAMLVLVMGEAAWAFCLRYTDEESCFLCYQDPPESNNWRCDISYDKDPPGSTSPFGLYGIAKYVIGKSGVTISPNVQPPVTITDVQPPVPWGFVLVPGGPPPAMPGNELHLIPDQVITEDVVRRLKAPWSFRFSVDKDTEGLFVWYSLEHQTRRILDRAHIINIIKKK